MTLTITFETRDGCSGGILTSARVDRGRSDCELRGRVSVGLVRNGNGLACLGLDQFTLTLTGAQIVRSPDGTVVAALLDELPTPELATDGLDVDAFLAALHTRYGFRVHQANGTVYEILPSLFPYISQVYKVPANLPPRDPEAEQLILDLL